MKTILTGNSLQSHIIQSDDQGHESLSDAVQREGTWLKSPSVILRHLPPCSCGVET
ncbi:hypothetical protein AB6A23_24215 [Paenibacillus tarimensis]